MEQTKKLIIKRLSAEDICTFKETLVRFIYESNRNCVFMNRYSMNDAADKWSQLYNYAADGKAVVYGAVSTDTDTEILVGFVWAYEYPFREDENRLYVSILHVDEKYRSMGAGKKLMDNIEAYAETRKYDSVYMHVEGVNDRGIKFYNRQGYETERIQLAKKIL